MGSQTQLIGGAVDFCRRVWLNALLVFAPNSIRERRENSHHGWVKERRYPCTGFDEAFPGRHVAATAPNASVQWVGRPMLDDPLRAVLTCDDAPPWRKIYDYCEVAIVSLPV